MDSSTTLVGVAAVSLTTLVALVYVARLFLPSLKQADPNEWLIVIRNGEQRLAGVGLKTWVWPMETCVTFPSVLTKVSFEAMQTTQEMQGVKITGFAVFSVLRTEDGPFRYYKYVQGAGKAMAEDNLKGMAESLTRKHVATINLNAVLRDREMLRNAVHTEMMKTTKGWGVWLETLEIKDVQICSKALFEDLQAEYRQDTHVKAEQVRLQSQKVLAEQRADHERDMALLNSETALARAKAQADEKTTREKYEGDAQLERARVQAELAKKNLEIEQQKIDTERQVEMARQSLQHELQQQAEKHRQDRAAATHEHELRLRRSTIQLDGEMSDRAMQKYMVDSTAQIYNKLPLKELKLHNFVAPDAGNGLAAMLPGVSALSQTMKEGWQSVQE